MTGESQEVTVREARLEDLQEVVDLLAGDDPREGGDLAPYAAAFARIAADRNQVLAVADLGGQVVGTIQLSFVPSLARRGHTRAEIEGVHTLPTLRGRGIGDTLFAWAFDEAERRGAALMRICAESERVNVHRFYEHLGFSGKYIGFTKHLGRRRG